MVIEMDYSPTTRKKMKQKVRALSTRKSNVTVVGGSVLIGVARKCTIKQRKQIALQCVIIIIFFSSFEMAENT